MKIQVLQYEVVLSDFEENTQKIIQLMQQVDEDTDIVVIPEMWNTGYALKKLDQYADEAIKKSYAFIAQLAKEKQVNIIAGSVSNKKENAIYNTGFAVDRNGQLLHQTDKVHLVPMLDEHLYLKGASTLPHAFELMDTKMGQVICYDLRFPEVIRQPIKEGAEIIFVVAQWTSKHAVHWSKLLQARAIENSCYVVGCNAVGPIESLPGATYCGESAVVNPYGEVIAALDNQEGILTVNIDLNEVAIQRQTVPVIDNMRRDLY